MNNQESAVTLTQLTNLSLDVESTMLEVEASCSPPDPDLLPQLFVSLREKLDVLDDSVDRAGGVDTLGPEAVVLRRTFESLRQTNRRIGALLELWRHHTDQALLLLGSSADDTYGAGGLRERQLATRNLGTS